MVSQENNTSELQNEIADRLNKSQMWIVLRNDNEGVHLHMPNEDHLILLGLFFKAHPAMLKLVNRMVNK
jgi:formate-dependent nitrite reductase cytochrome c552 subunit